jgi:hypothetical protein
MPGYVFGIARTTSRFAPQASLRKAMVVPAAMESMSVLPAAIAFSRTASVLRICGLSAITQARIGRDFTAPIAGTTRTRASSRELEKILSGAWARRR